MKSRRLFSAASLAFAVSVALPAALVFVALVAACGAPQPPPATRPAGPPAAGTSPTAAESVTTSAPSSATSAASSAAPAATESLVVVDEVVGQGPAAKIGDTVSVNYVGTLTNGTEFDSSKKHGAFDFQLGEGRVIKGWDQGVAGMKVGGRRKLTIPPSLGYGSHSMGPIPSNAILLFEVELLAITPGEGTPDSPNGTPKHSDKPSHITARHVLIQWMGCQSASSSVVRTQEQALKVAQDVLRRAKGGADFARLAVEYSDEANAGHRGGSLGNFGHGQMVKQFEDAAFALAPGEISGIVESPFGYHIIQRTE